MLLRHLNSHYCLVLSEPLVQLLGVFCQICAAFHPVCHQLAVSLLFPSIAVLSQCGEGLGALQAVWRCWHRGIHSVMSIATNSSVISFLLGKSMDDTPETWSNVTLLPDESLLSCHLVCLERGGLFFCFFFFFLLLCMHSKQINCKGR